MEKYRNYQEIKSAFKVCGIKKNDVIFIHADEILSTQIKFEKRTVDPTMLFIETLIDFIGGVGTIIIPTFTYSFIKKKKYDIENSSSEVGNFSEKFRLVDNVSRSKNPIFSVASIGKYSNQITNSSITTCFGKDSIFDLLNFYDAKIFCIGCSFNRVTFVHYVEEKLNVCYRYHKVFKGKILKNNEVKNNVVIDYFVRDLSFDTVCNLGNLKNIMIKKKKLITADFGRLRTYTCSSKSFFDLARNLLINNKFGLINFGNK
jgi:aminoglycoside 3-N-acetyltransferase